MDAVIVFDGQLLRTNKRRNNKRTIVSCMCRPQNNNTVVVVLRVTKAELKTSPNAQYNLTQTEPNSKNVPFTSILVIIYD